MWRMLCGSFHSSLQSTVTIMFLKVRFHFSDGEEGPALGVDISSVLSLWLFHRAHRIILAYNIELQCPTYSFSTLL